jgi:hypothetical protein
MIKRQNKILPILYELNNYKPSKIKVLSKGSLNWNYNNQKFNNVLDKKLYVDGIYINMMPSNVCPPFPLNYIVKGIYNNELKLYVIDDIDIPNTLIEERQKFLLSLYIDNNMNCVSNSIKWIPNVLMGKK